MTRRDALRALGIWLNASPLLRSQQAPHLAQRLPAMDELVNVLEFEPAARRQLPVYNYDYIAGGVDDEWTLRRNREAFHSITLRPRMLRDVSKLDLSLTLFGQRLDMPILVAPTGGQGLAHPQGEPAMARAAGAMKTIMVVSSNSTYTIQQIGQAATGPLWFQLYPGPDLDATRQHVEAAVAAGCKAIAVTVETSYDSHRERLLRDRQGQPTATGRRRADPTPNPYRLSQRFTAGLTWTFIDQLNAYAKVPVVVKGILTPEDAKLAIEHGAAGVIVSNHGARYLDGNPATIEALPPIVDAVAGRVPVLADGGFRRGTDVLKGLAIGAKAVLVGRPPLWGLAAYGQAGAQRVLDLLQAELALAMGLSGQANLAAIDRSLVQIHAAPPAESTAASEP